MAAFELTGSVAFWSLFDLHNMLMDNEIGYVAEQFS